MNGTFDFIDTQTQELRVLVADWRDFLQLRIGMEQRGSALGGELERLEVKARRRLMRSLRAHPLWPWLSQYPGLGGGHTALLIATIGDPRRFPGQACSEGHILPAGVYAEGDRCPHEVWDTGDESAYERDPTNARPCPGTLLGPRTSTGVRSLWHYCGLMPDDTGRLVRKRKGQQASFSPKLRASILGPEGIAHQIVRHRTPKYRELYDVTKERVTKERGADAAPAIEDQARPATTSDGVDTRLESDGGGIPLRPIRIERIARTVAAKAFVGDLLVAWKCLAEG